MPPSGVISSGYAWERRSRCRKAAGTHWNDGVPSVEDFKNALCTASRTIFRAKCRTGLQDFSYTISKFFQC